MTQVALPQRHAHRRGGGVRRIGRLASLATATAAVAYGFRKRWVPSVALAVAAAPFAYRGFTGEWPSVKNGRASGDTKVALGRGRGVYVRESIRIERSLDEVYRFWRRFENLPRYMAHLERITDLGSGRSRWVADGPAGMRVEWDAEIINEIRNKVIAWRS